MIEIEFATAIKMGMGLAFGWLIVTVSANAIRKMFDI